MKAPAGGVKGRWRRGSAGRAGKAPAGRAGADRGAASLWVLAIGLVLLAAGLAGAAVGAARVARHEARVAADLGALAGAMRALDGTEVACARAAALVTRNGGRITGCTVDGLDVTVTVEVEVTPLPGLARTAGATARAGPVRSAA
jgi:secretion/DNA translocation related TadE-like protein